MPGLHHIELWLPASGSARRSWAWLLRRVGFDCVSEWTGGESWGAEGIYISLVHAPSMTSDVHDRRRAGVNHLAFRVGSADVCDAVMAEAEEHGWSALYSDRYPHAGGAAHYAGWLENAEGFKAEIVADAVVPHARDDAEPGRVRRGAELRDAEREGRGDEHRV